MMQPHSGIHATITWNKKYLYILLHVTQDILLNEKSRFQNRIYNTIKLCVFTHMCMCICVCALAYIFTKKQWKINPKTNKNIHLYGEGEYGEAEARMEAEILGTLLFLT